MLKILACFKMTDNLEEVTSDEWNRCLDDGEPQFMNQQLATYDESALENALRLKDEALEAEQEVATTALTIGPELPELVAKNLYGVKYDKVVYLESDRDMRFRPDVVAETIAAFAKQEGGFDVILTGQQANVGDNAQTHLLLAAQLGMTCVLNVMAVHVKEEGLEVTSLTDEGILTQTIQTPVVLAVGNAEHAFLRVATLRERMAAGKKTIEQPDAAAYLPEEKAAKAAYVKLHRQKKTRDCRIIEGESAEEKARILYDTCLKEVLNA